MYSELFDTDNGMEMITWKSEEAAQLEAADGQSRAIERRPVCDSCLVSYNSSLIDLHNLGTAEHTVRWVDEGGHEWDTERHICSECLAAGDPQGPGYRRV